MKHWQLQEAKAKLSHLIYLTTTKGPQGISVRGKEEVVIISKKAYEELLGKKPTLIEFFTSSPLYDIDLDLERDKSPSRDDITL